MFEVSAWPPAGVFLSGAVLGILLAAAVWGAFETRRRNEVAAPKALTLATEALLESIPIPTVVFSDSMRPLFHNSAYEGNAAAVRRVLNKEWLQRTVLQVLMEGKGVSRHSDPDNQQSVHITPLTDGLVAVMIWDESDRYSAEAMRQDFIANASHELNTPVSAILLLSEALLRKAGGDKTARRFVETLHGEAERLSSLTRDIGRLAAAQARTEPGIVEPIEVLDVVDSTVAHHAALAGGAHVNLVWDRSAFAEGMRVSVDEQMLGMALGNILENAIQHSPRDGSVSLRVKPSSSGEAVLISIEDQGPGIEPSEVERVFQRFYRVDQSRERKSGGTGLGLSIARNIARGAGGDVSVKTFPGEGATFIVTLPTVNTKDEQ